MVQFRRSPSGPRVRFEPDEAGALEAVLAQYEQLLFGAASAAHGPSAQHDPLVELTGMNDRAELDRRTDPPEDPALRRLLPDAYRDDPQAAADFRRYTEDTLLSGKRTDLTAVRACLAEIEASKSRTITLDDDRTQAWLRTLTDLRLVLGVRLGLETDADTEALTVAVAFGGADDTTRAAAQLFEDLGALLDGLLDVAR
jgi:Domain of unknown function (DUF2017)